MTTTQCTTTSNVVDVDDVEAVKKLVEEYDVIPRPKFKEGTMWFAEHAAFDIMENGPDNDKEREFLEKLQNHIKADLEIMCVGNTGLRHPLIGSAFIIEKDGEIRFEHLRGGYTIKEEDE